MTATLLPPNSTPLERALAAVIARISDVPVPVGDLWHPARCPAPLLPWLAWSLSVDDWSSDWPDAQQREVIAASVEIHRHKGSRWSVRRALSVMGYGDCDVTEGWQTMVGGPWVVGDDPAPMRDLLAGTGGLAVEVARASSATCVDAAGLVVSVGANQPRMDHDPITLEPRGLLLERAGANLMGWSELVEAGGKWLAIQNGAASPVGGPRGQTGAWRFTPTAGTTGNQRLKTPSSPVEAGTRYSVQMWLRAAGCRYVSITAPIMGGATALVDLDSGSVTGAGARIAATVDGWHHVLIEGRLAATTVVDGINIWAANAAGATVFAADGVAGFDIWHPQIEAGAVCTSYIPTANGAATRAADQLVLPARLGTRELTITTASWTVTLPAAEMTGDLRPAVIMPTHVQRIETGPADGPQPIPVPVGGAGHWAEYWVTVRAPVMPEAVAAIARRLASVAPARCHLTRIDVDAVTVVVGGPWVVGAPDVTVGATYPTTEIL